MHLPACPDSKVNEAEGTDATHAEARRHSPPGEHLEISRGVGPPSGAGLIRPFQTIDRGDFRRLNEAWISRHFALEPEDIELLSDPEGKILARGGHIFVAVARQGGEEEVIGCYALLPLPCNVLRLARMTVREDHRGKGIGRRLLNHAIISAQAFHARKLVLETSRKLESAVHLYQSAGFCFTPSEPAGSRPLARADLYMELLLPDG